MIVVDEFLNKNSIKKIKNQIVFQLVNTEQNKEVLWDVPHRPFLDLSLTYTWLRDSGPDVLKNPLIHDSFAKKLGLSEEQLFELALANTERIFPSTLTNMYEEFSNVKDVTIEKLPDDQTLWILKNDNGHHGAVAVLYEDLLQGLAERVGTDLYLLPSSLHEMIAVSTNMGSPKELAQIVVDVNATIHPSDRLSNQVYHYDKELRRISLATDTPNKRLDGVSEKSNLIQSDRQRKPKKSKSVR